MTRCHRSRCRALAQASYSSMDRALAITRAVAKSARHGIAVVLLGAATEAQSQVQTRLAIDGSVGASRIAGGGPYSERDGLAANAVAALRWTASSGHSAVVGLSAARVVGPVGDEAVVCPSPDTCPTRSPAIRGSLALACGCDELPRRRARALTTPNERVALPGEGAGVGCTMLIVHSARGGLSLVHCVGAPRGRGSHTAYETRGCRGGAGSDRSPRLG